MSNPQRGFTLIEILVVMAILATLAGMVSLITIGAQRRAIRMECTQHVQQLAGLLEASDRYPDAAGANLLLYLVRKGQVAGKDALGALFCPGDARESLALAGGEQAYEGLDLARREHGHLTSYAGRDQSDPERRAKKGAMAVVLLADDSEDHHFGEGVVVGLSGGGARWRDKVDDYGMSKDAPLLVGPGSSEPELACLRSD
jgi:prepilin-type N-terminal cleavage/methylation domain-containing protein